MSDQGPRFCPRCGTARVPEMRFCPQCGLDLGDAHAGAPSADTAVDSLEPPVVTRTPERSRLSSLGVPPVVTFVALVIVGLLVLGFLPRIQLGAAPGPAAQPSPFGLASVEPGAPTAPIVGLTILSPVDGQAVATKDVVVIGVAPPGMTITHDVSFGLDNHTKADGTGHWAMSVGLGNGDNKLTFRIGDDKSTSKTIRVIYTPPGG